MIYYDTTAIEAVNNGKPTPDAFYEPGHPSRLIATSQDVATDGWRGYSKIIPAAGFRAVETDWTTGDWGDAIAAEHGTTPTERKLRVLAREHGDVYVIFTPTSNVFSTSYAVLVRDGAAPSSPGTLIAHKTRRFDAPNGSWRVQYHATNVVTYDAARDVYTLDTGGWNTMMTSKRMTEALPAGWYVYRKNWVMYLHRPGADDEAIKDGMEVAA